MSSRLSRLLASATLLTLGACLDSSRPVAPTEPAAAPRLNGGAVTGPSVVISQVYGAGGNTGALINADFVELFNRGDAALTLDGYSLQYASSTGNFGASAAQIVALSGSIEPGQYVLVRMTPVGTVGQPTPTPDLTGTTNASGTSGKFALVNGTAQLNCNGTTIACPNTLIDVVGYGTAATFAEGGAPTGNTSATLAAFRKDGGCTDTNNNGADFELLAPAPRNRASTRKTCGVVAPNPVTRVAVSPSSASLVEGANITLTATTFGAGDAVVTGRAVQWNSSNPAVATVNVLGVVTAIATGTANITATSEGVTSPAATISVTPPAPVPTVRISELHYDNTSFDVNERIEVEGPAGTDLTGWKVLLYNGDDGLVYSTLPLTGAIPATCSARGVVVIDLPQNGLQNGPDGLALVNAANEVIEFLSYEGVFTATDGAAATLTSTNIGVSEVSAPYGFSLQRSANGATWAAPAAATFGGCNGTGVFPTQPGFVLVDGRETSDPPVPVGFQIQLFGSVRDSFGATLTAPLTWSSDTPAIASVDTRGVVTGLDAGSAVVRATSGSATGTFTVPVIVGVAGVVNGFPTPYDGNAEFGEPADGTPSDDIVLRRTEYTSSWNPTRGIPNWVAYNLEANHFGSADRCNCFTFDPLLPAELPRYTTADYTGAGTVAGFGIDRGHLARSADRTTGSLDNARTFYFSNIIPQAADNNQGPWAIFENALGDLARADKEVYIIAGASGSQGTVKNEGRITIPEWTWKVALAYPRNTRLSDVTDRTPVEIYAVVMPNRAGIRNVPWQSYLVTVDSVESLSGYDLLALLPDAIESQYERGNRFPTASLNGPFTGAEGSAIAMSGVGSTDPDAGDALTYAWTFSDGTTATGATVNKTFAQSGTYTVTLRVTDKAGASHTTVTTATVANVAPNVTLTPAATWRAGTSSALGVSWTDPAGARDATYRVNINWGDGTSSSYSSLTVPTTVQQRLKTYAAPGQYTVTVTVTDRDGGIGTQTVIITVVAP